MNIGQASEASGLPAKTIRYYEEIDLVRAERAANGYRDYSEAAVHKLRFVHRARDLGFSIYECRQLLALYEDENRSSADVKSLALTKIEEVERKIRHLKEMQSTLEHLAKTCHGDKRPDCPILDELANSELSK